MAQDDSGGDSGCPVGEILAAVLGTFFGTLIFCVVLALLLVLVYRRRQQRSMTAQRLAPCSIPKKPSSSPVSVQTYTNAEYLTSETDGNHSTLPIRNSVSADDNADVTTGECDEGSAIARGSHFRQGQQSIVQLRLEGRDVLGAGFDIRAADDESGKLVVSEVLSSASDVLRSLMNAGDELLRIDISVVPQMSLANASTILRAAAACPVRLTLLRQRDEQQPDVADGRDSSWISSPEYLEPPLSEPRLRCRSDELASRRAPEITVGVEFDGHHRTQSYDDVGRESPLMAAGSVSGAVGVHSTYIDLSTVVPPAQSSSSQQWTDTDSLSPPAAFYKTQSSPTLDKMLEPSAIFPTTSSTQRLAQSVDELCTHVRRKESQNEDLASYATAVDSKYAEERNLDSNSPAPDASSHLEEPDEDDHGYNNVPDNNDHGLDNGKTESVLSTPMFAEDSKGVATNAAESASINHSNGHLEQASDTGLHGSQTLRTAVEDADLGGVERALRAPERSAGGGLAYYINLEDHHFSGFPGHMDEGRAHSFDDSRATS